MEHNEDKQSILKSENELCTQVPELETFCRRKGMKLDDSGKYRIQFMDTKQPGSYVLDRSAAQALVRVMKWWVKDNPQTDDLHAELLSCQPGEPDVLVAIYIRYTTGRIVRHTVATNRRQTVDWGSEQ
jgi:hypothetical protein